MSGFLLLCPIITFLLSIGLRPLCIRLGAYILCDRSWMSCIDSYHVYDSRLAVSRMDAQWGAFANIYLVLYSKIGRDEIVFRVSRYDTRGIHVEMCE